MPRLNNRLSDLGDENAGWPRPRELAQLPALSVRDLGYFLAVARAGRITDAADDLGILQPTLSRRIARVEKLMGTALFERHGHQLILNTRGEALVEAAKRIVADARGGVGEVHRLMDPEHGTVRLDFMHSLGTWMIPQLLRAYRQDHPFVDVQLHQGAASELTHRVETGQSDIAFIGPKPPHARDHRGDLDPGEATAGELRWFQLHAQPLALAIPEDHPLASAGSAPIALRDAASESFIGMLPGYGTRLLLDRLSVEAGFTPRLVFESMELSTVAGLVSAGLGVALLPVDDPYLAPTGLVLRPLSPPTFRELGIVWRHGIEHAPPVEQFRRFVCVRSRQ